MVIINSEDEKYPKKLLEISNFPKKLYVEGDYNLLNKKSIAIVGSRNCSEYGYKYAKKFARELAEKDYCIVSGLALGIDAAAHIGALNEIGKTIAVIGSGIDKISSNKKLSEEILKNGGCIISEYSPKTEATSKYFPARNRIVSGLSDGVLVVEAAHRSGTSITAKMAVNQGKPLFCLPHNLGEVNGVGINRLIQDGGRLVTCVEDILFELEFLKMEYNKENEEEERKLFLKNKRKKEKQFKEKNMQLEIKVINIKEEYLPVYNVLSYQPIFINEICKKTNLDISKVNYILTMLELDGCIERIAGNQVVVKEKFSV